jgi:hypothetical protein
MAKQELSPALRFGDAPQSSGAQAAHAPARNRSARDRMEDDAIYFSRRAREERQAYLRGDSRKCRLLHLELADAYEFRAHLLTRELRRQADEELSEAL